MLVEITVSNLVEGVMETETYGLAIPSLIYAKTAVKHMACLWRNKVIEAGCINEVLKDQYRPPKHDPEFVYDSMDPDDDEEVAKPAPNMKLWRSNTNIKKATPKTSSKGKSSKGKGSIFNLPDRPTFPPRSAVKAKLEPFPSVWEEVKGQIHDSNSSSGSEPTTPARWNAGSQHRGMNCVPPVALKRRGPTSSIFTRAPKNDLEKEYSYMQGEGSVSVEVGEEMRKLREAMSERDREEAFDIAKKKAGVRLYATDDEQAEDPMDDVTSRLSGDGDN
jgi:hypothetical protein